jgi:hypothetical protein
MQRLMVDKTSLLLGFGQKVGGGRKFPFMYMQKKRKEDYGVFFRRGLRMAACVWSFFIENVM